MPAEYQANAGERKDYCTVSCSFIIIPIKTNSMIHIILQGLVCSQLAIKRPSKETSKCLHLLPLKGLSKANKEVHLFSYIDISI